jgi:hypothetical protein
MDDATLMNFLAQEPELRIRAQLLVEMGCTPEELKQLYVQQPDQVERLLQRVKNRSEAQRKADDDLAFDLYRCFLRIAIGDEL